MMVLNTIYEWIDMLCLNLLIWFDKVSYEHGAEVFLVLMILYVLVQVAINATSGSYEEDEV